jgi:serine/threonine protein kinase
LSGITQAAPDHPPAADTNALTPRDPAEPYRQVQRAARGNRRDCGRNPQPLARGGQADVFEAIHKPTDTPVAVKHLVVVTNEDAVARMRREIDAAHQLGGHPHIMPILDHSNAHDWFVMPLAAGTAETLRIDELADRNQLRVMIDNLCQVLKAAHEQGWLHRDVKPSNVLKLDGRWMLADWGMVRRPGGTTSIPRRTRTGVFPGTEGFAAPELSHNAHAAGPAADIYSVGQLIGRACLGSWPQANIPLLPDDPGWRDIVEAATRYEPADRPATVDDLQILIGQYLEPDWRKG